MSTSGPFDLTGTTALVTGGTRGIGRALARCLAASGARVAFTGRRPEAVRTSAEEMSSEGAAVRGLVWDASTSSAADLLHAVTVELGAVDILVNNAGVIDRAPATGYSRGSWDGVLAVNLTATFELCQAAGRRMLERGGGKIVNVASVLAVSGGRDVIAYAASKAAVVGLTRSLAVEWSASGVNVNAVAVGYVESDLTAPLRADPNRQAQILARIPAGRWGRPEDVGGAVVFLSSAAADYVHGAVLPVDGGWTAA